MSPDDAFLCDLPFSFVFFFWFLMMPNWGGAGWSRILREKRKFWYCVLEYISSPVGKAHAEPIQPHAAGARHLGKGNRDKKIS